MNPARCIRAAVPDADDAFCDHILWGRTPFPMGKVTARDIYKAASRFDRATRKGIQLCDFCDNIAVDGWNCKACNDALRAPHPNAVAPERQQQQTLRIEGVPSALSEGES